jgi:L-lactate dehydrogenase complex protein LldG
MAAPGVGKMSQSTSAREQILAAIRNATAVPATDSSVKLRAARQSNARSDDSEAAVEQFMLFAREEAATTERVPEAADIPAAVLRYLRSERLSLRLIIARNARTSAVDWASAEDLDCTAGPVGADGDTVVTGCYAGVAEAGAVVTLSSSDHPSEFNFLAATHIVIVQASVVVDSFEELWSRLRADYAENWPRMMNFIVGPSRTADLGVPSRLGAHGPSRVHIVVVGP